MTEPKLAVVTLRVAEPDELLLGLEALFDAGVEMELIHGTQRQAVHQFVDQLNKAVNGPTEPSKGGS